MFYVIKHIPTETWIPALQSSRERSHYYSFLEGKSVTTNPIFEKKNLDFKKAFKYRQRDLAEIFIEKMPKKLRLPNNTPEEIMAMFEVVEFKTYPREELVLCESRNEVEQRNAFNTHKIKVDQIKTNWFDYSDEHCSQCGSLLPPGVKYLNHFTQKICFFCLNEAFQLINENIKDFKDQELLKDIQSERFVHNL